jgi:hypothetical protein
MPFGKKPNPTTGAIIDFDFIYRQIIAPGIAAADMDAVRLDMEQMGGVIHRASFEMMVYSDFVVADVSTANPNVMYDLGVRHSFQPRGTVMLLQTGSRLPFNLQPFFVMPYSVDAQGVPDRAEVDRAQLADVLRFARSDAVTSPVYQLLAGVRPPLLDRSNSVVFRSQTAYENSVAGRITFAAASGLAAVRAVEEDLRREGDLATGIVTSVFNAYRSLGGWEDLLRISAILPENISQSRDVQEQLAEALNAIGRPDEAEQKMKPLLEQDADSPAHQVWGDIQRMRWMASDAAGESLRARTYIKEAIGSYVRAFESDPRAVASGARALLLTEIANRPAEQPALKGAVEYSARVRIRLPGPTCLECVSTALVAALIGDRPLSDDALDRLPLAPVDLPAINGTIEDLGLLRDSRARNGLNQPAWLAQLEQLLSQALAPKQSGSPKPGAQQGAQPGPGNGRTGASKVDAKKDFFISYTKDDQDWATWIAWTLEEAGYTVVIQAWDFQPGADFVQQMDKALRLTTRTILVLSEAFFKSFYTTAEWSAAFTKDPAGERGLLVPVRVRECKPEGLLSSKIYVDLVGLSEDDAKAVLLGAFSVRARPLQAPQFPGARVAPTPAAFPGEPTRGSRSDVIAAQIKRASEHQTVEPQPPALSRLERLNLIRQLNEIPPELFNMIIYAVNPPAGVVPPAPASQGQRSSALLLWAEGPAGRGVSEIQATLADLLKS